MSGAESLTQIAADGRVEAIRIGLVGTSDLATAVRLEDGRWHLVNLDDGSLAGNYTLAEMEEFAIIPVALVADAPARDDAAELREAVREWAHRMDESHAPRWWEQPAVTDRMAAEAELRRLAASEGQS